MDKLLYTIPEVCELTSLGATTIWSAIRRGELKVCRIGRAVRVKADCLERFIAEKGSA